MGSFTCIVAADRRRGIGKNGEMPWRLRREMRFFVTETSATTCPGASNAVVMGRKTWLSLHRRPLPHRLNIVLSRNPLELPTRVLAAVSLDQALALANQHGAENTFVIGGGEIYSQAVQHPACNRVLYTRLDA